MAEKRRITHQDVARAAGVSTATVSYVINNGPRPTSPEVRERVLQAIRDLDYHPNAMARGLRARRTGTVGYVVNDFNALDVFTSSYSARVLTGLAARLKQSQQYVLVYPMVIGEELRPLEQLLRSGRLDGVVVRLVQDAPETDVLLEMIRATGIPCVCIERPAAPRFGLVSLTYDDRAGAYAATRYLIERGHRRIGHLGGDMRYATAQARLGGYQRALEEHGLPPDPALVAGGADWSPTTVDAGLERLLALPEPPTALVAASDDFALRALELLRARGVRVPEDVAVIGFDDLGAEMAIPALTTVRIPLLELGARAAERLLELVEGQPGAAPEAEQLPVELIRRASA